MLRLRGDPALNIEKFAERIQDLPKTRGAIARKVSTEILPRLVEQGFKRRSDPYGVAWLPALDGHLPQLERSGSLRRGYKFSARTTPYGISIVVYNTATRADSDRKRRSGGDVRYWTFLQSGTANMEARKQTIDPDKPLPDDWVRLIARTYVAVINQHLKEGRISL